MKWLSWRKRIEEFELADDKQLAFDLSLKLHPKQVPLKNKDKWIV